MCPSSPDTSTDWLFPWASDFSASAASFYIKNLGQTTHWANQALQTQWGNPLDLPGAKSLVSVRVFVLNFRVLKED